MRKRKNPIGKYGLGERGEEDDKNIYGIADNDYAHLLLAMGSRAENPVVLMPGSSFVLCEESFHEGPKLFIKSRQSWFGWAGRSAQIESFEVFHRHFHTSASRTIYEYYMRHSNYNLAASFYYYGIYSTLQEARQVHQLGNALLLLISQLFLLPYRLLCVSVQRLGKIFKS